MQPERPIPRSQIPVEWLKCAASPAYFTTCYVWIYRASSSGVDDLPAWAPFDLWPAQVRTLRRMARASRLVVLKARQLGLSWLALAYALWLMTFRARRRCCSSA